MTSAAVLLALISACLARTRVFPTGSPSTAPSTATRATSATGTPMSSTESVPAQSTESVPAQSTEAVPAQSCGPFELACGGSCIPDYWVCDGEEDCDDGSDEQGCFEVLYNCGLNELQCANKCIPKSWQCDGVDDCDDGRDELQDDCLPDARLFGCFLQHARIGFFGQLIDSKAFVSEDDCKEFCLQYNHCSAVALSPRGYTWAGVRTCFLYSGSLYVEAEEWGWAAARRSCFDEACEFQCTDKCIQAEKKCDGQEDCANGADERFCGQYGFYSEEGMVYH